MKKILVGLFLLSGTAWGTYIPVNGSTVTVLPSNGGSFPIISSQTIKVDGSAVTQPISGNVGQSGTWTVQPGNTANTTAWKVDGSAVTQPVSGTVTANAGTGSFNVNQSTVAVMNVSGGKLLVTPDSVALPANQSVNVSQINAVTPLMGAGNTGTGSPRVTLATDNAAIATWGQGATGGAVPSGAVYQGGIAKTALPAAATDGNMVGSFRDKFGRTVIIGDCPRDLILSTGTTITSNTAELTLLAAGAAGVFNDAVAIVATNSSATASLLTFRTNGAGTTSTLHFYLPAGDTRGISLPHIWPQGTAAAVWTVQASASVASIYVDMTYCQNK